MPQVELADAAQHGHRVSTCLHQPMRGEATVSFNTTTGRAHGWLGTHVGAGSGLTSEPPERRTLEAARLKLLRCLVTRANSTTAFDDLASQAVTREMLWKVSNATTGAAFEV